MARLPRLQSGSPLSDATQQPLKKTCPHLRVSLSPSAKWAHSQHSPGQGEDQHTQLPLGNHHGYSHCGCFSQGAQIWVQPAQEVALRGWDEKTWVWGGGEAFSMGVSGTCQPPELLVVAPGPGPSSYVIWPTPSIDSGHRDEERDPPSRASPKANSTGEAPRAWAPNPGCLFPPGAAHSHTAPLPAGAVFPRAGPGFLLCSYPQNMAMPSVLAKLMIGNWDTVGLISWLG